MTTTASTASKFCARSRSECSDIFFLNLTSWRILGNIEPWPECSLCLSKKEVFGAGSVKGSRAARRPADMAFVGYIACVLHDSPCGVRIAFGDSGETLRSKLLPGAKKRALQSHENKSPTRCAPGSQNQNDIKFGCHLHPGVICF